MTPLIQPNQQRLLTQLPAMRRKYSLDGLPRQYQQADPFPGLAGKSPMLTAGDRSDVAANGSAVADSAGVWFTDPNTPLVVLKMPLNSNLTTAVPNNSN